MYIHRRNEKVILGKLPEHPSRIHGAQEASSTSSSLGPERLQQGVPYNGHKKLMTTSDLHPARVSCGVQVREVEDGAVRLTPTVQGPFGGGQLAREVSSGKLARVNCKLELNKRTCINLPGLSCVL